MEKHELESFTSTCTLSCNVLLQDCTRHNIESGSQEHGEQNIVPCDQESGSHKLGGLVYGDGVTPRRSTHHFRPPGQWWMANTRAGDIATNMAKPHQLVEPT
jgi:hypothetical protein